MDENVAQSARITAIVVAMMLSLILPGVSIARQDQATEDAGQAPETTQAAGNDAGDGFDDWGPFGLLGLVGLAGLFRRPASHEPAVDPTTNPIEQPAVDRGDDAGGRRSSDFI